MVSVRQWRFNHPRLLQIAFWLWLAPFVLASAGVELTHSANCPDNIFVRWAIHSGSTHFQKPAAVTSDDDADCAACAFAWATMAVFAALAVATITQALPLTFSAPRRTLLTRCPALTASRGPPAFARL